ncbi:hypothetical protein HDV06_004781 [Boothiomyces sp. JEL0866]|nr:hypothetical protein HDV06_004781 [Boothiomyces sp. JEL0866]
MEVTMNEKDIDYYFSNPDAKSDWQGLDPNLMSTFSLCSTFNSPVLSAADSSMLFDDPLLFCPLMLTETNSPHDLALMPADKLFQEESVPLLLEDSTSSNTDDVDGESCTESDQSSECCPVENVAIPTRLSSEPTIFEGFTNSKLDWCRYVGAF